MEQDRLTDNKYKTMAKLISGTSVYGNIYIATFVSAIGNVTGNYFLGNGACLTGVITSVANINNGTSNVTVVSSGGNVTVGVGGTPNVAVFATSGIVIASNVTSGNANITTQINTTSVSASGNIRTAGTVSSTGNITGSFFLGNGSALTGISVS